MPEDLADRFHSVSISRDGASSTIAEYVDGTLIASAYTEYSQAPKYVDATGATMVQAMHLMIGDQAIPFSLPGSSTVAGDDGIPGGWTITVQEIAAWYGTIAEGSFRWP